jgi:hypothetical protein
MWRRFGLPGVIAVRLNIHTPADDSKLCHIRCWRRIRGERRAELFSSHSAALDDQTMFPCQDGDHLLLRDPCRARY